MKPWTWRLSAGAMGAFFFLVMGIWALVSAIEWDWVTRDGVASWYSWPAAAVPQSLQDSSAAWTCSLSLGADCAPVAAPTEHAGLSCWGANGATWCADPKFATATVIWSFVSLACFILSRLLWPALGTLPPEAGPRARRNHALFQIGLELVMIVWMGWTVYDIVQNPGGTDEAACAGSGTACVYDVAERLPEALFYVVMVLVGVVGMIDTSMHYRREIFMRAQPAPESV